MKKVFLTYFLIIISIIVNVQLYAQRAVSLENQILDSYFSPPFDGQQPKRSFIEKDKNNQIGHVIAGGLIYFYQNAISEQIQADCTYEITCSQYIKLCIERYGFFKGSFAGLNQYMKCSMDNSSNHEPHKLNNDGKIVNHPDDEQ